TVDGTEVNLVDVNGDAVTANESTVPLRAVLGAMGYSVSYEDGTITAGTKGDPEFVFTESDSPYEIINGTTYIPYDEVENKGLAYTAEVTDGEIAYTNVYADIEEGYYRIKLGDKYLTAPTLPEEEIVEEATDEDGNTVENVITPRAQVNAKSLSLAEADNSAYQLWLIKKVSDKRYVVLSAATDYAMDVNDWSNECGMKIIQYTLAGGGNQRWTFTQTDEGYKIASVYSKLPLAELAEDDTERGYSAGTLIQTSTSEGAQNWTLEFEKEYVNPVEAALETEAYAELDPYIQEKFYTYLFTDVDFSESANTKAETYLREAGFTDADKETQKQLIIDCLSITYSDLLGGSMYEKLTANYTISEPEEITIGEGEEAKHYYSYTVTMECTSAEDTTTFLVDTVDENDLDYVNQVAEAIACYEPPIRKTLKVFYYTGDNYGTWNAWDGEVWNNTGGKTGVDGMLNMFSHELGHVIDSYFECGDDVWRRAINQDIIHTSTYGQTNRWEDFGEFSCIYLLYRGNEQKMEALEAIYPNRTKTFRAYLYNIDNDYYAEYKDDYDDVIASIGNTSAIDGESYCSITDYETGKALTNNDGALTLEDYTGSDSQLWQIGVSDEQTGKIYSKADGSSITVSSTLVNSDVEVNNDSATLLGLQPDDGGAYVLTVSETGYTIASNDDGIIATYSDAVAWVITPVEKIEGMGQYMIMSGDKYLSVANEERGSAITLSDTATTWFINKLPNNVGYITDTATDFAIDISGASEEAGAPAITYTLSRDANQMWLIEDNGDGTVSFQAQHSGLYLAIDEDGNAVQSTEKYSWTLVSAE
ncbi:MAG: RICIN domain-containing protein, partial [Clostridia bacterium]|nr:RICIN domain-containing protein [Clostridia bacterium]